MLRRSQICSAAADLSCRQKDLYQRLQSGRLLEDIAAVSPDDLSDAVPAILAGILDDNTAAPLRASACKTVQTLSAWRRLHPALAAAGAPRVLVRCLLLEEEEETENPDVIAAAAAALARLAEDEGPRHDIVTAGGAPVVCRVLDRALENGNSSSNSSKAATAAVAHLVDGGLAAQRQLADAGAMLLLVRLLGDRRSSYALVRTAGAAIRQLAASPAVRSERLLEASTALMHLLHCDCPDVAEAARSSMAAIASRPDPCLRAALAWGPR